MNNVGGNHSLTPTQASAEDSNVPLLQSLPSNQLQKILKEQEVRRQDLVQRTMRLEQQIRENEAMLQMQLLRASTFMQAEHSTDKLPKSCPFAVGVRSSDDSFIHTQYESTHSTSTTHCPPPFGAFQSSALPPFSDTNDIQATRVRYTIHQKKKFQKKCFF